MSKHPQPVLESVIEVSDVVKWLLDFCGCARLGSAVVSNAEIGINLTTTCQYVLNSLL